MPRPPEITTLAPYTLRRSDSAIVLLRNRLRSETKSLVKALHAQHYTFTCSGSQNLSYGSLKNFNRNTLVFTVAIAYPAFKIDAQSIRRLNFI